MADELKEPVVTRHFPDDILIEIFFRLPVKSLFLFRSVSKHWLNLMQNPTFITMHINRPLDNYNNHDPMLIVRTVESESQSRKSNIVLTLQSEDETLPCKDEVALHFLSSSIASRAAHEAMFQLLGPCNGVFCVSDMYDVVVFNPATRRCRKVPRSPFSIKSRACHDMGRYISFFDYVGFGCDPVSKDYKVVTFDKIIQHDIDDDNSDYVDTDVDEEDDIYDDYDGNYVDGEVYRYSDETDADDDDVDAEVVVDEHEDDDDDCDFHGVRFKVGIFSLSTNCWRELNSVMPTGNMSTIHSDSLFFNGAVHWLGGNDDNFGSILVFDLSKEAFKRFELPNIYIEDEVYLSVLTESLNMVVHKESKFRSSDGVFEIWVMKEYGVIESWRKLYNISPDVGIDRPLSLSKKEILLEKYDGQLASYNLETKAIKNFQLHGSSWLSHAFRYRESLVSLK